MLSLERKKLYKILEISSIFVGVIMALYYFYPVFASPPTTPYAPGETTNPTCSPGDTNCTVYPPLTTSLTTSTAIIMGTSSLRFAYDATNYTSFVIASDGGLTVSSTNSATTTFINKTLFSSNAYFNTIASGTWNGVAIALAYGGTNSSTISANGSIIYSDGTRYNASAVGTSGQFLQSSGSGAPVWVNSTSMGFVNLQGVSSGTQQTGNLNISGTGLFGTRVGINTTTLTSYALAVSGTAYVADLIAKGGVFVDVRAYGATNDASTDSTGAFQAAIDAAYLNLGNAVGGIVYIPAGIYYISATLNITNSRIHIYGAGKNATFITFNPGSAGLPVFHFNGGASVLFQNSISDLSINGQGGLQKIGIQLTDTSEMRVEDVSMLYMNGNSSIGIKLRGREMTTLNRITLSADRPIVISDNPNSTIDVDHLHVQDAYLIASGTNPNVTIDSGVNLTNVVFDGTQAWVLGGYGLQWIDTSTVAASANLSIKNVRWEQSTNANGYFIDIEHNDVLQNLSLENLYGGLSTNGIKLRKVNWANIENYLYVDTSKTAMDVNTTTYPLVFKNVFFQQGSTSTFGGLTTIMDTGRDTIGGTTFGLAVYDVPSATGVSSLYRLTVGTTTLNANPFSVVSSSAAGGSMLSLLTNGRFGISSSSPIASLAVQGASGNNPFFVNSSTGSSLLSILQNGNVGIGTAAAGKLLELYENDGTAPELKINNAYTTHSQGVSNTGYVRFTGLVAPGGNNNVEDKFLMGLRSGALNTAWDFVVRDTVASADRLVINQSGDMSIGTSTSITATLTVQARGGINPFVINSSTGNPMLNVLTNGNVGIGITTPAVKLQILSANSGGVDDLMFSNDASGNYRNGIRNLQSSGSAAGNMMEFVVGNGTVTGETPVMYLLGDGRVGISTTTPPAQLSIYRSLATSTPSFDISSSTGLSMFRVLANGSVGISSSSPIATLAVQGNDGANPFSINSSTGASLLTILTNGNVGIGTSSPGAPLSVDVTDAGSGNRTLVAIFGRTGASQIVTERAAGFVFRDSNNPTFTAGMAGIRQNSNNDFNGSLGFYINSGTQTQLFSGLTEAMRINNLGNVGIGTTTPISRLTVQGAGTANPFSVVSSTAAASSMFTILTNGNVGIGTSTPTQKLSVVGNISNIIDPASGVISQISTTAVGTNPRSVFVSGRYTYVANSNSGNISVVDISNPSFPVQISTAAVGTNPRSIFVSGRYAYTANHDDNTVSVVDISNPSAAVQISTVAVGAGPQSIYVAGRYAYVTNEASNTISVVDISNPLIPVQIATTSVGTQPWSIYVSGRYAYVANLGGNISVVDISNPAAPVEIATAAAGVGPASIYISGRYAYVANFSSDNISIINIANPAAPSQVATVGVGGGPNSIYVSGRYAYVTNQNAATISIVDISSSTSPSQVATTTVGATPFSIYISGRYAYVANYSDSNISVVDISGTEVTSLIAHSAEVGNLQSRNDIFAQGSIMAGTSLLVGAGGFMSQGSVSIFASSTGATSSIFSIDSAQTSNIFKVFANGNIGIGTSSPAARLTLQGSGTSNPFSIVSSTAAASSMFTVLTNGNIGINSSTPIAALAVQGIAGNNPIFEVASSSGSSFLRVLANGNVGIGTTTPVSTFVVVGTTTIDGGIRVGNGTASLPSYSFINDTDTGFYNVSANTIMAVAGGGNSVQFNNGSIGIGGNGTATAAGISFGGDTNTGFWSPAVEQLAITTNGINRFTVSTTALTINSTNIPGFNIGIGTTTPIATFAIQGNTSSNPFSVNSSTGAALLNVLTNGNVGIGITAPVTKLQILSANNIAINDLMFSNDASGNYRNAISNKQIAGTDVGNLMVFLVGNGTVTGQTTVMSLEGTGNVGIGTTTPIARLTIQGAGTYNPFSIVSSTAAAFSMLTILTNGNVGINTSTPNSRLDIWGSGNTSTTLSLNTFSASGTSTFKIDNAGNASFTNDGLYYEASSSVSYINSFETGGLNFDDNAGLVSWVDMNVSSSVAGTSNAYTASIGGNPMIMVYGDSNGTGGVTNMTVSIGTSTTSTYKLYVDAGVSTTAGLGVNGFIKATGYIAGTTTLDIAETYPVDPECDTNGNCPQVGDVVCSAEDTSSTFFIEQCSATSTDKIIGVVSGNPGFILGGYDVKDTKIKGLYPTSFRPIALAGRVPVNVSTANGAIKAGDYLTSSAIPGVAVKTLEPGKVIGMALQSFDGSLAATGTVTVFVNTSWSPGSLAALTEAEESIFPDFTKIVLDKFTLAVKNSLRKLGLLVKNGIATVKEVFADKVTTQQLCVGSTCVNESQLQEILNKTQTQAAPAIDIQSPPVSVIPTPAGESLSPTSTVSTTTIVVPVETGIQSSSTPDVTIPVEPVIVIVETATTT